MKKSTIFLLISLLCLFFTLSATAHSGRTDSKGGHYNHSTGDYHYHHGYPPHDHYNGECPYLKKESQKETEDKQEEKKCIGDYFFKCFGVFNSRRIGWFDYCFNYYGNIYCGTNVSR